MTAINKQVEALERQLHASSDGEGEIVAVENFLSSLSKHSLPSLVGYFGSHFDDLLLKLKQLTIQSKPPGQQARIENPQAWLTLAWGLIDSRLPQIGLELLSAIYEFQLEQQYQMRRRIYKGISLQNLGWAYLLLGQKKPARRYTELALIEEVIASMDVDEGQQIRVVTASLAYRTLEQYFREPPAVLDALVQAARSYLVTQSPSRYLHPEDCYVAYLRAVSSGRIKPSTGFGERSYSFNYSYFSSLLELLDRSVASNKSVIADIACYLFSNIDGLEICSYPISGTKFDIILRNNASYPALKMLGTFIAVDWQSWDTLLKETLLLNIAQKLLSNNLRTCILFSREGYPEELHPQPQTIKRTLLELHTKKQVNILVIDYHNLVCIERGQTTLESVLKIKYELLRFGEQEYEKQLETPSLTAPTIKINKTSNRPKLVIKNKPTAIEHKPAAPLKIPEVVLNPCTVCRNLTSLKCQKCNKPYCNLHLQMPSQLCSICIGEQEDIELSLE
ncbi:MAG: hypothetical protein RMM17_13160 [Acidobacteriota bacterium]|nr:hypothetical protein [Acidobacteriota bacterium]